MKYSWRQFNRDCKKLANQLPEVKNIYGVPRGGLITAVVLSHLINKPLIFNLNEIDNKTLIIDDIVDSGETFREILMKINRIPLTASLWFNEESEFTPHYFIRLKKDWVQFPWETIQSSKYDGTRIT